MKPKRQFYIPNVVFWNWKLISPVFVQLQLDRAQLSYTETDNALEQLEAHIKEIRSEIYANWGRANANDMWGYEAQLKEIRAENKRISYVRLRLREVIDRMVKHLENVA